MGNNRSRIRHVSHERHAGIGERIGHTMTLVNGMVIGAGIMYAFDPQRGAARRSYARDKLIRGANATGCFLRKRGQDVANRAWGSVAEVFATVKDSNIEIPDYKLEQRVRAQLGHVLSHPGGIEVLAHDGVVTISGPVLRGEEQKIRERLAKTRGVRECILQVREHEEKDVPSLQGVSKSEQRVGTR